MDARTPEHQDTSAPIEVAGMDATAPGPQDERSRRKRRGAGFAWGIATGSVVIVAILSAAFITWQVVVLRPLQRSPVPSSPITVNAVETGTPWFTVGGDGRGTLEGWNAGGSGSGSAGPGEPSESIGYIGVGAVGVVDGVRISHNVNVQLTPKTAIIIGGKSYDKGKSSSPAAAILGDGQGYDDFPSDVLEDRPLTIEFHRDGDFIVADRISAPLETSQNPLNFSSYY